VSAPANFHLSLSRSLALRVSAALHCTHAPPNSAHFTAISLSISCVRFLAFNGYLSNPSYSFFPFPTTNHLCSWFAVHFSSRLQTDSLIPFELFGEEWVLFRDRQGRAACVRDECAHRACPLSLGKVVDGEVQCAYHGWQFNGRGCCTVMPSTVLCRGVGVSSLPCVEREGFVWVWPGLGDPTPLANEVLAPPQGYKIHAEIEVEVPVEHGLLIENLLDLAHAPFTHTTTFARGWPVPDVVRFQAAKVLSGNWNPYPIDMAFLPPCMTMSNIGLAQPGRVARGARAEACANHLHQVHVCLPSRRGHTRLLYRMSLDFMSWARFIPGIKQAWEKVAAQVLGEDLVLVLGQQDRMLRGGDIWANPVSYDKLAVRYRRWRNDVASGGGGAAVLDPGARMDAGQMFSLDEGDADLYVDYTAVETAAKAGAKAELGSNG
jgi:chlorophyllide a oxygenase